MTFKIVCDAKHSLTRPNARHSRKKTFVNNFIEFNCNRATHTHTLRRINYKSHPNRCWPPVQWLLVRRILILNIYSSRDHEIISRYRYTYGKFRLTKFRKIDASKNCRWCAAHNLPVYFFFQFRVWMDFLSCVRTNHLTRLQLFSHICFIIHRLWRLTFRMTQARHFNERKKHIDRFGGFDRVQFEINWSIVRISCLAVTIHFIKLHMSAEIEKVNDNHYMDCIRVPAVCCLCIILNTDNTASVIISIHDKFLSTQPSQ